MRFRPLGFLRGLDLQEGGYNLQGLLGFRTSRRGFKGLICIKKGVFLGLMEFRTPGRELQTLVGFRPLGRIIAGFRTSGRVV